MTLQEGFIYGLMRVVLRVPFGTRGGLVRSREGLLVAGVDGQPWSG